LLGIGVVIDYAVNIGGFLESMQKNSDTRIFQLERCTW